MSDPRAPLHLTSDDIEEFQLAVRNLIRRFEEEHNGAIISDLRLSRATSIGYRQGAVIAVEAKIEVVFP